MRAATQEIAAVGGYRPEIDGLRMIAVLAVIFYHAGFPGFGGGYVGVDIFFVISGFLITAIIAREIDAGKFTYREFYERRARRILPALFAVCAASAIAAWFLLSPGQMRHFGQSLVATMGFGANIYFYLTSGYFSPAIHTLPLIHMWSLAVEEQFYVVFPIVLVLVARFAPRTRLALVVAIFVVSLAASLAVQASHPLENFYLVPLRAWELMAGSLLALEEARVRTWVARHRAAADAVAWAGLAAMVLPVALYSDQTVFPGLAAVPVVLGTAAFIGASTGGGRARALMALRPFVYIGLISYAAYLWHQPLFAFAQIWKGGALAMPVKIALIVATLALASLSLVIVERPFRRKDRVSRRAIAIVSVAGLLGFTALGAVLHLRDGFPSRFSSVQNRLAGTMTVSPEREACHTWGTDYRKPAEACRYGGADIRWAVLGDSHGIELAHALSERLEKRGQGLVHLTFSGCAPAYALAFDNPGCPAWTREAVGWLADQRGITDVLLVYRHPQYLNGDQTESYPEVPRDFPHLVPPATPDAARAAYWRSFEAELATLVAAGKRVWIVAPVPDLPAPVEQFIFTPAGRGSPGPVSRAWYDRRAEPIRNRLELLANRYSAHFIDPAATICDAAGCAWRRDGRSFYFDDNHLSVDGARAVIDEQLAPRIALDSGD